MGIDSAALREKALKSTVAEYNPKNLPPREAFLNPDGSISHIWIDLQRYAIAMSAFEDDDLERPDDGGLDELFTL